MLNESRMEFSQYILFNFNVIRCFHYAMLFNYSFTMQPYRLDSILIMFNFIFKPEILRRTCFEWNKKKNNVHTQWLEC